MLVPFLYALSHEELPNPEGEMKVTLALLGLGSVAALQLGGSVRTVQLGGARAPSRTSRVICGWGPDPVWSALEVGSIKDAAEGLKAITIKPADGAADAFTVAGQYVQIREIGAEKAGIFAIASSPTKAGDFEFLIKEQPESDWSPGTGWLTDSKAGLALEMSQVMGPGFKIDGVLDDIDNVRQRGQSVPPLAVPQLGSCTSGCAWRFRAARHSQRETQPLGAQHWVPNHRHGCSRAPPPKSPIAPRLTMQVLLFAVGSGISPIRSVMALALDPTLALTMALAPTLALTLTLALAPTLGLTLALASP